ncbi:MAG: ABC transporter substrate-binding protein, partial [Chloroflexi bacterium]
LVAVYEDQDPFAQNLIDNFTQQFVADGHDNPPRVTYQRLSTPAQMAEILKKALQMGPEAILLAGSRSTDTGNFLAAIPDSSNVKVLTDASIYPIADAPPGKFGHTSRLVFVSPGFPDEWNIIPSSIKAPSFFNEYKDKFDPYNQHKGVPYGYQRPDASAMQAYDAVLALVKGIRLARTTHQNVISGDDLQQALQQIKGSQAVQGVTGQISFGTDGDPVNKEIVVLQAEEHGLQLRYYQGCFQVGDRDCGGHFVE